MSKCICDPYLDGKLYNPDCPSCSDYKREENNRPTLADAARDMAGALRVVLDPKEDSAISNMIKLTISKYEEAIKCTEQS